MGKAARLKRERKADKTSQRIRLERFAGFELGFFSDQQIEEICIAEKHFGDLKTIFHLIMNQEWSPLHIAAAHNNGNAAKELIAAGANLNIVDKKMMTPLHNAVICGTPEFVEILLTAGARPNPQDNHSATPLHLAVGVNKPEMVKALIAGGADVNFVAAYGFTPLHAASISKDEKSVRILMECGADMEAIDDYGKTPAEHSDLIAKVKLEKEAESLKESHGTPASGGRPDRRGGAL